MKRDEEIQVLKRKYGMSTRSLCESSVKDELVSRGVLSCARDSKTLHASFAPLSARACENAQVGFLATLGLVNCPAESNQERDLQIEQFDAQFAKLFLRALEIREETHAGKASNWPSIREFLESRDSNALEFESRDPNACSIRNTRGLLKITQGGCMHYNRISDLGPS